MVVNAKIIRAEYLIDEMVVRLKLRPEPVFYDPKDVDIHINEKNVTVVMWALRSITEAAGIEEIAGTVIRVEFDGVRVKRIGHAIFNVWIDIKE